ncbi:MAG TPA: hypothetical protein VJP80_05590 [Candidatus Saccharimonadales bacterium]|nr:hypothetical protein [Candidatus Saccharimonadales bacterium]
MAPSQSVPLASGGSPGGTPAVRNEASAAFVLPILVFGAVEVRRLRRELEALEDFMEQASLRQPGTQPALPRLSRLCEGLAQDNRLNLLQADHRRALASFLEQLEVQAPRLHVSFAADPSSAFTAKLVGWLRANVHPFALLEVGLQPTIAAGCVVRTTNKVFDLSLRERFADSQKLLLDALEAATAAPTPPLPQQQQPASVVAATPPTPPVAQPSPVVAAPRAEPLTPIPQPTETPA